MANFNKFNAFVDALHKKIHNINTDVLKVMFTNVAPVATNAVKADITELAAGNGYTAGGFVSAQTLSNSSGTEKLVCADVVLTATGAVGPFRYVVLYNSTATNGDLIAWWDYGSAVTLANTETFTTDFDGAAGVYTMA